MDDLCVPSVTWVTTELRGEVHVHPFYENGHILGPWCWCSPTIEREDEWPMYTHHDHLDRTVPTEQKGDDDR